MRDLGDNTHGKSPDVHLGDTSDQRTFAEQMAGEGHLGEALKEKDDSSASLAEAMMGAAFGINPVPANRSEAEEAENAAAQVALLQDLAGELSFLDFEELLATARAELNKLDLHPSPAGTRT